MTTLDDRPSAPSVAPAAVRDPRVHVPKAPPRLAVLHPRGWAPFLVLLAGLAVLWEWGAAEMPYLLAPLSDVGATLLGNPMHYVANAWVTLQEALAGLIIGFLASFVIAIFVSEVPVLRRAIMPIAVVLNVTPLVAIAPALVVAFGFGPEPKLIVTALIVFFPILINISSGLRSVPPAVLQFYTVIKASRLELLWHVRIPNSLPYIFAALKIVFPLSIIGAVVAEMAAPGATAGLGTVISVASSMNKLSVVYASIFMLALLGSLLLAVVTLTERRVLHWHESNAPGNS